MFGTRKTGMKIELNQVKEQLRNVIRDRDSFAREASQIRQALDESAADNRTLKNQVEYLVRTIRDMDEQIFKMSQCTSFDQMRPNFNNLAEGMTMRKRQESDRISTIIRQELISTYKPSETRNESQRIHDQGRTSDEKAGPSPRQLPRSAPQHRED